MDRKDLQKILKRSEGKHRISSYIMVGDDVIAETERAELVDPENGPQSRTITVERRGLCACNHVLSDSNPIVAVCGVRGCGKKLCKTPGCVEHCAASGCGVPTCSRHRKMIRNEHFCYPWHVFTRCVWLILGF